MAADTKDSKTSKTFLGHSNSSVSVGKTYDTFDYPATKDNLNSLPGANAHGPPASAGLIDALKSIKLEDFKEVHKKPCTPPIFTACSWAVGAFAFGSFAMHEYCQQKRRLEKAGIQRINAALDEKKIELEKKREEKRKARRKAKEEADR
ncbi:MAG: hypothetical protein L6R41_001418 [Letrouitia leprolyta]|nr:MAG: hypothetical protein L6R41_001418 [Letrouitia leprolyta]